ncbi:transglycosylase domain-containing protein [Actinoplanes sp. NPDC051343]|uniref:transglycosylase domain-containing protein n=1 Tax=Actinoplanes sp. NPDC051343 TaxID=3363906 RepID=UPI0037B85A37
MGGAAVGGAAVGGAPVGSARPGGRASIGSASVGSAAVGAGGRPAVARAAVRPGGGGPGMPPGTGDDGALGSGGRGGKKDKSKAAKRRRRTNILTAAAAVVVILLGAGVVGGTYFFDSVELPPPVSEDQSNTILDGAGNVLAKVGEQNRTVVPEAKINKVVEHAVAAAEDKNFYTHHGIDMKGIVRAAWNNFTGGATQGASTITQQYARHVANLKAISINRKLREAVIARKLESQYDKNQIMGMYLNYIDLGEGRQGIEAAAQGYFGKSVTTPVGQKNAITPDEAAVLASIIKQPYPVKGGAPGFDPNYNLAGAKDRWEYTMKNMVDMHWITQQEYDQRKYPAVKKPSSDTCKTCAADKPVGMIIRHVKAELNAAGIPESAFEQGGLTVNTTINPDVQKAAEEAGSAKSKSSPMHGLPKTYQAAVIAIDPNTGRVLGYFGGDDPNGLDYGGYMAGDGSKITGGQSPGSSFKIYTLAAGLKQGLSFDSKWDAKQPRKNGTKINNAGADDNALCKGSPRDCDLETATIKSYNFPFYWIADAVGSGTVAETAKEAGLTHIFQDGKTTPVDLTKTDTSALNKDFDDEIGFGQYRVVPLEHAEGVATIIGGGVHHVAHFIKSVTQVNADNGKKDVLLSENTSGNRVFPAAETSNELGVMQKIVKADDLDLKNGRESAAKSGTWEYDDGKDKHIGSGDCWFVGGIPQLAVTVWVGGKQKKVELHLKDGRDMFGASVPGEIWQKTLNDSAKALDMKQVDFPDRITTGDPSKFGNGVAPPPVQPQNNNCALAVIGISCDNNGGNNNGGGQGNGGGNNNGGGQGNGGGNNGGGQTNGGTAGFPGNNGGNTGGTGAQNNDVTLQPGQGTNGGG